MVDSDKNNIALSLCIKYENILNVVNSIHIKTKIIEILRFVSLQELDVKACCRAFVRVCEYSYVSCDGCALLLKSGAVSKLYYRIVCHR